MLPVQSSAGALTAVAREGVPVTTHTETIKGIVYAFFPVTTGGYEALYGTTTDAPAGNRNRGAFALNVIAPNPSPDPTRVEFAVGEEARVRLSVVDLLGREVAVLADAVYPPGDHEAWWNGNGPRGRVSPGIYFVRFEVAGHQLMRRMVRVR